MQSVVQLLDHFRSHNVRSRISQALGQEQVQRQKQQNADFSWLQTFEKPLCSLQSLMLWEKPNHTMLFLLSFHCSYWYDSFQM
jgi:hypothetical protein